MFSHIYIGASDFTRAHTFYAPLMSELGLRERFYVSERSWAGWQPGNVRDTEGNKVCLVCHDPM